MSGPHCPKPVVYGLFHHRRCRRSWRQEQSEGRPCDAAGACRRPIRLPANITCLWTNYHAHVHKYGVGAGHNCTLRGWITPTHTHLYKFGSPVVCDTVKGRGGGYWVAYMLTWKDFEGPGVGGMVNTWGGSRVIVMVVGNWVLSGASCGMALVWWQVLNSRKRWGLDLDVFNSFFLFSFRFLSFFTFSSLSL